MLSEIVRGADIFVAIVFFQRVQASHMKYFIESLHNVIGNLNHFIGLSVNRSAASFNRINIGINKMVQLVVQADLEYLNGILTDYHDGYEVQHAIIVYISQVLLQDTFPLLSLVVSGDWLVTENETLSTLYAQMLTRSLNDVLSVNANPKSGTKDAPSRLLHGPHNDCEQYIESILNQWSMYTERRDKAFQQNVSSINISYEFYMVQNIYNCIKGLESNLNGISFITDELNNTMTQPGDKGDDLDFYKHSEKMSNELNILQNVSDWLSQKLSAYSENRTTKISLANQITSSMLLNIKEAMNRILSLINVDVIEPLLSRSSDVDKDVPRLYRKILNAMRSLTPYYDGTAAVEDKLRLLQIWRYPLARMDTTDVLQFMYPLSEAWRTWALSVPLHEFVSSGSAVKVVSSMVNEYSTVLTKELLQMRSLHENSRNNVIKNFKKVLGDLARIQTESAMADDFVLWVFNYTIFSNTLFVYAF